MTMATPPPESLDRRAWIARSLAAGAALPLIGRAGPAVAAQGREPDGAFRIAPFRCDVTPPEGHPLCGGWITPATEVDDPLEAVGFVLLGAGEPVVVCAVDWTGILNEAHLAWRERIAAAVGTRPERVAVQCVHQHDAPFACLASNRILREAGAEGLSTVDEGFFEAALGRVASAAAAAVGEAVPLTHVAAASAEVGEVAANRRVERDESGHVLRMRGSSCRIPELVALPEGLVDPLLRTVAFYSGDRRVLACHYYACHPMSHYGRGRVSSDFVGLARKRRQAADPGCLHAYFTGCAGNIGAGKYNDGSEPLRTILSERIETAMLAAEAALEPVPVESARWADEAVLPEPNPLFSEAGELAMVADAGNAASNRIRPAMRASWIRRLAEEVPIVLSALHFNESVSLLHLPAESFVEYQIRASAIGGSRFVATAAYGDGGPWYIPVAEAYPGGGYEVRVANCAHTVDDLLTQGMRRLLA